jgi:hypothetical protein
VPGADPLRDRDLAALTNFHILKYEY